MEMDESWLQYLIAECLTQRFTTTSVERQDNSTYDIRVTLTTGKVFVVQVYSEV